MKKILLTAFSAVFILSTAAFAGYDSDVMKGDAAYNSGDIGAALEYYRQAYKQAPDRALGEFIKEIERFSGAGETGLAPVQEYDTPAGGLPGAPAELPAAEQKESAGKTHFDSTDLSTYKVPEAAAPAPAAQFKAHPASVAMVFTDIALAVSMVYTYVDHEVSKVDLAQSVVNYFMDPTEQNAIRVATDAEREHFKSNASIISAGLAGAAILYTFMDVFWLKAAFPARVAVAPDNDGIKLAVNTEF